MDAARAHTSTSPSPSPNGANGSSGRDARGRFSAGNHGGPGNPAAKKVAALRTALLASVTPADLRAAMKSLVKKARAGDIPAIKELLDKTLGKPASSVELNVDSLGSATPIIEIQVDSPAHLAALLQNPELARLALSGRLAGVPAEQAALRG